VGRGVRACAGQACAGVYSLQAHRHCAAHMIYLAGACLGALQEVFLKDRLIELVECKSMLLIDAAA
jgi:hypothetical protein